MEIFHDKQERRTILLALKNLDDAESFRAFLELDYNLICPDAGEDVSEKLIKLAGSISAAIIDIDIAMTDDFKVLRTASDDPLASTVPIIIATVREPTD